MAGPSREGAADAVQLDRMHELLWRDEPGISTPTGVRFHDPPTEVDRDRKDLRVLVTSPGPGRSLVDVGIDARGSTAFDSGSTTTSTTGLRIAVHELLAAHGCTDRSRSTRARRTPPRTSSVSSPLHKNRVAKIPISAHWCSLAQWWAGRDRRATVVVWCRANCYGSLSRRHRRRVRPTREGWDCRRSRH